MTKHMPDPDTLAKLREQSAQGPVVLLNLLRYHVPDGRQAFARYGEITGPLIAAAGGQVIFAGKAGPVLTGSDTEWDDALLVRFPTVERFLDMIEGETYTQHAAPIRAEALDATLWLAIDPFPPFAGD